MDVIIIILLCMLLSNNISDVNSTRLNTTEIIVINSNNYSIISYLIPICKEIKFIRVRFESNLKGNQSLSIKSRSDKSEFKLINTHNQSIVITERTICSNKQIKQCKKNNEKMEILPLLIINNSQEPISINVTAFVIEGFTISIGENRSLTIDDNSPIYWLLKFNISNVDMEIRIDSEDEHCMYAFTEQAECSPNLLNPHVDIDRRKTITKKGSIHIQNYRQYKNNLLFIVFILIENNICKKNLKNQDNSIIENKFRKKNFNIKFVNIDASHLKIGFGLSGIFILVGFFYTLFYLCYICLDPRDPSANPNDDKCSIFCNWCCGEYRLDCNYIFVIAVFYALPVAQLIWHLKNNMDEHGDFDKCFYNDHCSKPLGRIISFNSVISNIGYVILGTAFMVIVSINRCMNKNSLGYSNYGIFYALGFSLIMEGVMSASYHICPRSDTIQFDVTFMYIIGFLLNLYYAIKLLPKSDNVNIDKKSKDFYLFMSVVMLIIIVLLIIEDTIGMLGKWMVLPDLHIAFIFWSLIIFKPLAVNSNDFLKSAHLLIFTNICVVCFGIIWIKEFYSYFLVAILANVVILLLECYLNMEKRIPYWQYEIPCCGVNIIFGFLREIFYFLRNIGREIFCLDSKYMLKKIYNNKFISINIILSGVLWIWAIILYYKAPTDWNSPPSKSREHNQDCIWWNYFDIHDAWHVVSSIAMFFSFMWIFMIDGETKGNNGEQINPT